MHRARSIDHLPRVAFRTIAPTEISRDADIAAYDSVNQRDCTVFAAGVDADLELHNETVED